MAEDVDDKNNEQADEVEDTTEDGAEETTGPPLKADGTPYTLKDIAALQEALKKERRATRQAKRKDVVAEEEGGKSPEDLEKQISSRIEAKYRPIVINSAARQALLAAGVKAERLEKALGVLSHDDLVLNDDGSVDGLDDQVQELKDDIPEWFPRRRVSANVDAADRPGDGNRKPLTASERQAALLTGGVRQ
jgi:hypothetical protein